MREITEKWLSEYNGERPHESLNNMTLEEYRQYHYLAEISKKPGTKTGLFTEVSHVIQLSLHFLLSHTDRFYFEKN